MGHAKRVTRRRSAFRLRARLFGTRRRQRLRPRLEAAWGTTREAQKRGEIEALGVEGIVWARAARSNPSPQEGGERAPLSLLGRWRGRAPSPRTSSSRSLPMQRVILCFAIRRGPRRLEAELPRLSLHRRRLWRSGGAWVDETSECRPVSERARHRVAAENAWQRFGEETGVPVAIVRLAGIYGPDAGRSRSSERHGPPHRQARPGVQPHPCRRHRADRRGGVRPRADGMFNGTDDEPAPPEEVLPMRRSCSGFRRRRRFPSKKPT